MKLGTCFIRWPGLAWKSVQSISLLLWFVFINLRLIIYADFNQWANRFEIHFRLAYNFVV